MFIVNKIKVNYDLRLPHALQEDRKLGLVPFYVSDFD